jgi:hypothetical protein
MFAKLARAPKSCALFAATTAVALMVLATSDSAWAGRAKTNNGAPSATAIYNGASNDIRDHRGQRGNVVAPPPQHPHQGCRNPYTGAARCTVRDHRGEPPGGGGSSLCGHGTGVNCPPLHNK